MNVWAAHAVRFRSTHAIFPAMHTTRRFLPTLLCGVALLAAPLAGRAAPLSDDDSKFMTIYEQVLKALVTDNLNAAKDAAHAMPGSAGQGILDAKDLKAARESFAVMSQTAEQKIAGNPDFHVFYCPMAKKDWVQRTTTVANPYMGKDMLDCGVPKKS